MTSLWTVYERLQPLQYMARLSLIDEAGARDGDRVLVSSYLDALRNELAGRGLRPMPADPNDDPQIVELWL